MTAAHCITTQFDHTIGQITYSVSVKNPYDASQFSVYVGAHGISFLTNPQFLYNEMAVKRIIRVIYSVIDFSLILNFYLK